jgi:Tfp pilus assembly protein PilO
MNKNILAILALLLTVLLYPFVFADSMDKVTLLKSDIAKNSETLEKAEELLRLKTDLVRRAESFTQEELARLEKILPEKVDPAQILLDIYTLANSNGLVMLGDARVVKPEKVESSEDEALEKTNPIETVDVSFTIIGPYKNLPNFGEELAKSLTLFDIEELSFTKNESNIYTYDIRMKTYLLNKGGI